MKLNIQSIPVSPSSRKLKARWSPGSVQDMDAYHTKDAELQLTTSEAEFRVRPSPGDFVRMVYRDFVDTGGTGNWNSFEPKDVVLGGVYLGSYIHEEFKCEIHRVMTDRVIDLRECRGVITGYIIESITSSYGGHGVCE